MDNFLNAMVAGFGIIMILFSLALLIHESAKGKTEYRVLHECETRGNVELRGEIYVCELGLSR